MSPPTIRYMRVKSSTEAMKKINTPTMILDAAEMLRSFPNTHGEVCLSKY